MSTPAPSLTEADTGPFWRATAEHRLVYQRCNRCAGVTFYPRSHCTHCTSTSLSTCDSAGRGELYTYSVVRVNREPGFEALVPYIVAYVDLHEGFRLLTRIVGVEPNQVRIGMAVRLRWNDQVGFSLPEFEPDPDGE